MKRAEQEGGGHGGAAGRDADSLLLPTVAATPASVFFLELAQPLAPYSPRCVPGSACRW